MTKKSHRIDNLRIKNTSEKKAYVLLKRIDMKM